MRHKTLMVQKKKMLSFFSYEEILHCWDNCKKTQMSKYLKWWQNVDMDVSKTFIKIKICKHVLRGVRIRS